LRNKFCLGRYHTSSAAKLISKEADFIGLKGPLKSDRPWRIVAGPELGASAFRCAAVGGEEAVGAINRTNLKRWHEANARAEGKTVIKRHYPPVNVPGAPLVDLAPSKAETSDIPQAKALLSDDRLDIPNFLRRAARPPETLAAQNSPPQAVHLRKTRVKAEG
jgi:hypothetical protein